MTEHLDQKNTNRDLLHGTSFENSTDSVEDFVDAVALDGPLKDYDDLINASGALNDVLAFVEFGLEGANELGSLHDYSSVHRGVEQIIRACRLVSLRVGQYIEEADPCYSR